VGKLIRELARITSVQIGVEHHDVYTISLRLAGEGWCQSFGNLCLGKKHDPSEPSNAAYHFAQDLKEALGVEMLTDAVGGIVWALRRERFGLIEGIRAPFQDRRNTFTITKWQKRMEKLGIE
jgi:hypothetical protein